MTARGERPEIEPTMDLDKLNERVSAARAETEARGETFYPGASPDRVEALVTKPLEDELREISEIEELRSTSSSGVLRSTPCCQGPG